MAVSYFFQENDCRLYLSLDNIFNLSSSILDKSVAVTGKDALKGSITNYANYIEGRQVWNLQPYAEKLRAKYVE